MTGSAVSDRNDAGIGEHASGLDQDCMGVHPSCAIDGLSNRHNGKSTQQVGNFLWCGRRINSKDQEDLGIQIKQFTLLSRVQ